MRFTYNYRHPTGKGEDALVNLEVRRRPDFLAGQVTINTSTRKTCDNTGNLRKYWWGKTELCIRVKNREVNYKGNHVPPKVGCLVFIFSSFVRCGKIHKWQKIRSHNYRF